MNELNIRFKEKFGEFEKYVKEKYGVNSLSDDVFDNEGLKDKKVLWKHSRALRNILSHDGGMDFANITPEKLEEFCNAVDKIMHPKKAIELCIKANAVYKATENEIAINVIKTMLDNNYTCTPIIDNEQKIIGVFSSHSLMLYINKNPEVVEDFSKITIKDLIDVCKLNCNNDIEYKFISKDVQEDSIRELFKKSYEQGKRLETIFITHNGSNQEKILGIITHWDL